jgi:hypothetical protein
MKLEFSRQIFENTQLPYFMTASVWLACWPLAPEFAGSNPTEAVGFFSDVKEILSMPSFVGEVK